MKAIRRAWLWVAVSGAAVAALCLLPACRAPEPRDSVPVGRPPRMSPDYSGAVVPPNIAPLNFAVLEPGTAFWLEATGVQGTALSARSRDGHMEIPAPAWRGLLTANRDGVIDVRVHVRQEDGDWRAFAPFTVVVAPDPVDEYVVYRRFNVISGPYLRMLLCQRRLSDFATSVVLDNHSLDEGCMNCHTFLGNSTDRFVFHVRSGQQKDYGVSMVLVEDGQAVKVDTRTERTPRPAAFSSWHPSGSLVAFSFNKVRQFFHTARDEIRDGYDLDSDLAVYLLGEP